MDMTSPYTEKEKIDRIFRDIRARRARGERIVLGIQGVPPRKPLAGAIALSDEVIDLDMPIEGIGRGLSEPYLPRVYCSIIRTIVANAISIKGLTWLLLGTGIDKCDGGRFAAHQLGKILDIPVLGVENLEMEAQGYPICQSDLPLFEKMTLITRSVVRPLLPAEKTALESRRCRPAAGFWGVPPYDFDILKLFPNTTHVYGWTRCMENRTPADLELEMHVDPGIPTVFYAQTFCQKNSLAYWLAQKHDGLYVEVDGRLTNSTRAKVEAFIRLNGRGG